MLSCVQLTIVNVGLRFPESPNTAFLCISRMCSGVVANKLTNDDVLVPRGHVGDPHHGMALRQVEAFRQRVVYWVFLSAVTFGILFKLNSPKFRCSLVSSPSSRYPRTTLPSQFVTCFGRVDVSLNVLLRIHASACPM